MAAEQDTQSDDQTAPKGGAGTLVIVIVALLSIVAGAGGAYFVLDQQSAGAGDDTASPVEGADAEPAEPERYEDRLISLEPFVVNVNGDGYARFLKLKIELEASSMSVRDELESRRPQVRDAIILLLSSKRLGDISEFEGKALLKDDIQDRLDSLLPDGRVESVLFTEFVVQ